MYAGQGGNGGPPTRADQTPHGMAAAAAVADAMGRVN